MKRTIRSTLLLTLGVLIGVAGVTILRPPVHVLTSERSAFAITPMEAAMEKPIPEVWIEDVPVQEAARRLSQQTGFPIDLDVSSIEAAGISVTEPVTVRLRNAPLARVLDALCNSVSSTLRVRWAALPDGIVLTANDTTEARYCFVRNYDIRDLLRKDLEIFDDFPDVDPQIQLALPPTSTPEERLVDLIKNTVNPNGWRDIGGPAASVMTFGGTLVVNQNLVHHGEIRSLLTDLRNPPPTRAVPTGELPGAQRWHGILRRWVSTSPAGTLAKLDAPVAEFRFQHEPLQSAIRQLCDAAEVPVVFQNPIGVNWAQALGRPITAGGRGMALADALEEVLRGADAQQESRGALGWRLDGEVLVVGSGEAMGSLMLVTDAYDIRPLIASLHQAQTNPPLTDDLVVQKIMEVIEAGVDYDSWRATGGSYGTIKEVGGRLIITQTRGNHRKVIEMLAKLREKGIGATQPTGK